MRRIGLFLKDQLGPWESFWVFQYLKHTVTRKDLLLLLLMVVTAIYEENRQRLVLYSCSDNLTAQICLLWSCLSRQ